MKTKKISWVYPYTLIIPGVGKVRGLKGCTETFHFDPNNKIDLFIKETYEELMKLAGFKCLE